MNLTPDEFHVFTTSQCWRNFRQFYKTTDEALSAYASAAQSLDRPEKATHTIEWRLIYQDRAAGIISFLMLLAVPLGVHYSRYSVFRFTTTHSFSSQEARRLKLNRALGSLCYHLCFVFLILCGSGVFIGVLVQILGSYSFEMSLITALLMFGFGLSLYWARKSHSLALPGNLRIIAKDSFDLLNVKNIEVSR